MTTEEILRDLCAEVGCSAYRLSFSKGEHQYPCDAVRGRLKELEQVAAAARAWFAEEMRTGGGEDGDPLPAANLMRAVSALGDGTR